MSRLFICDTSYLIDSASFILSTIQKNKSGEDLEPFQGLIHLLKAFLEKHPCQDPFSYRELSRKAKPQQTPDDLIREEIRFVQSTDAVVLPYVRDFETWIDFEPVRTELDNLEISR